jgi:hypothetical protein
MISEFNALLHSSPYQMECAVAAVQDQEVVFYTCPDVADIHLRQERQPDIDRQDEQ